MYLFLNDVAGSEVLLILVFILIFFGSKSIPGIARTVGRTIRQIQDASSDIQNEIKKSAGDYKKELNLDGIFRDAADEVTRPLDQAVDDLDNSVRYTPPKRTAHVESPSEIANPVPEIPAQTEDTVTDDAEEALAIKSVENPEASQSERKVN